MPCSPENWPLVCWPRASASCRLRSSAPSRCTIPVGPASDAQQIQRLRSGGRRPQCGSGFLYRHLARGSRRGVDRLDRCRRSLLEARSDHRQPPFQPACPARSGPPPAFSPRPRNHASESSKAARTAQGAEDLDRWTAALGFCDLVSLYLLSGLSREVEFPLAHPASPEAQTAPRVKMQIEGRQASLSPPDRYAPAAP